MGMRFLMMLMALLTTSSCKKEVNENTSVNGIWRSVGSGWNLHIEDSTRYSFYDITPSSCLPARQGDLKELLGSLELKEDTLSLLKGVITYKFIREEQLPELCGTVVSEEMKKDPLYNFEVFAETVKEHYAFMELNTIDWNTLYERQKGKLNENTTDVDLYKVLEETLEKLNDNHAYLEATDEVYEALEAQEPDEQNDISNVEDLPEYGDFQIAAMVAKHHLKEEMTKDSWLVQWGKLNDTIGYIQVKSMWLYADLDIPETLIEEVGFVDAYVKTFYTMYEGDYIEKEEEGVRKIMDRVMQDLSSMESIVVDVRFNGGGQDAVSFEILRRFVSEKIQVATQKLRYGDQFSPTIPLHVNGTLEAYNKPVYILTSQQTGSAAEAFAIATMAMKNVKRIGAPTSGAMSTALEKKLPNGWYFSISNEVYMDNEGNNYENIGVPVDYKQEYPEDRQTFFRYIANNLEEDQQHILEAIKKLDSK